MGRKASSVEKPPANTPCAMHPDCREVAYGYVRHETLGLVAACKRCAYLLGFAFVLKG